MVTIVRFEIDDWLHVQAKNMKGSEGLQSKALKGRIFTVLDWKQSIMHDEIRSKKNRLYNRD